MVVYAQDDQESKAFSLKVNFLVRAVSFTVERSDSGDITVDDPAEFRGEGLPDWLCHRSFCGWKRQVELDPCFFGWFVGVQLTAGQLSGIEGSSGVIFEMDGQIFKFAGQTENAEFAVVSSGDDGGSGMVVIVLIVLAVFVVLGAGAFFFIEFEEVPDERG